MTRDEWTNLQIGDRISSIKSPYAQNLIVAEIAEDQRSLQHWKDRGHTDVERLCKMTRENDSFHTWDGIHDNWIKHG